MIWEEQELGCFHWGVNPGSTQQHRLKSEQGLLNLSIEKFLMEVEKKAYRMAQLATGNSSDALDIVQDTMIKLVEKYAGNPAEEWKPLFYRILQSRITDHLRKKTLQAKVFFWRSTSEESESGDLIDQASDYITPERELDGQRNVELVIDAVKKLPHRQQQCFLLRSWEGLSVKETALAMNCSEGSVKTHYSRAREALQQALEEVSSGTD
ncbi:RNA polymerase sigma factor [Aliikangiella sp. G2MR2-5]|uniref:RNA polymerase sigma factor n=1 Tax=Aliikangiella sp. G2MR2-5 TaxID=2788943 RepID=UPI0018A917D0|nr:RNA polymerase sigma factor [Aliikangiella sp. G2MR2-5]